jgi:hypothetical protein
VTNMACGAATINVDVVVHEGLEAERKLAVRLIDGGSFAVVQGQRRRKLIQERGKGIFLNRGLQQQIRMSGAHKGRDWGGDTVGDDSGPVWRGRGAEAAQSALYSAVGTCTVWPLARMLLVWALGHSARVGCTVH